MRAVRSAGNLFLSIVWLAAVTLSLASIMGYWIRVWGYIARDWPLALIIWVALKLLDHYRFKKAEKKGALLSTWEVASLLLVIFAGTAVTTAANITSDSDGIFGIGDIDLWDITGNNFKFEEHEEAAVPPDSVIEIVNLYGNIEVRPSDNDRVLLDVEKTIRASNKNEAERLSMDFTFTVSHDGQTYRIASTQDALVRAQSSPERPLIPRQRYKSSLTLRVPKRAMLRIDNRYGKVEVRDLVGAQEIANRYGQVDIRNIIGDVRIDNRYGDVTVRVPSNSFFVVSARTLVGQVDSEFDELKIIRSDGGSSASGQVGVAGGRQITISVRSGNIRITKER